MAVNFINKYPYTDFHELNLDWVINDLKSKAAGRWVTITIHPDEWDGNNQCVVTGLTGMTADTPFLWSWAPETIIEAAHANFVIPVARGNDEITFACDHTPSGDITFFLLIGD